VKIFPPLQQSHMNVTGLKVSRNNIDFVISPALVHFSPSHYYNFNNFLSSFNWDNAVKGTMPAWLYGSINFSRLPRLTPPRNTTSKFFNLKPISNSGSCANEETFVFANWFCTLNANQLLRVYFYTFSLLPCSVWWRRCRQSFYFRSRCDVSSVLFY
jgi:hypothetical protein